MVRVNYEHLIVYIRRRVLFYVFNIHTDVNFPAEQWQSFASQNPLMIALAYRTQSLDQVINMNPLFNPGGIGGANPYTLSGLYLTSQQPLVTFGLSGAMVSTNFVSFMKQKEKEIAKKLSATAPKVDDVKEDGYQAHHIIPKEFKYHPVIEKVGLDMDNANNGVFLRNRTSAKISPMARHQGYHRVYNKYAEKRLNQIELTKNVNEIERDVFTLQGNSLRPSGFDIEYEIDGRMRYTSIEN